jgi:3-hydroxyacyl-CoA dehydrogenase
LESKIEIFTLLDKICRPGTMLASNTASFSISEIAGVTYRAPKIVGMRFSRAGRLEIVQGAETDAETMTAAAEVGRRMGREVAVVPDYVSAS